MYETELAIINSAILNKNHLIKTMALSKEFFTNNGLKEVFQIMQDLYISGQEVDLPCISAALQDDKILPDLIRGQTTRNIDHLIQTLKEKEYKRQIQISAIDIYNSVKNGNADYEQFIEKINDIKQNYIHEENNFCELADYKDVELKKIFKRHRFIRTGLSVIDEKIVGLFRAQTSIIAGRPGTGKTSLALQIGRKHNSLFFSLEMKREELYAKILCSDANVETWKIESRKLDDSESIRVQDAHKAACEDLKMTVFDTDLTYADIMSNLNTFIRLKNPDLVVVDYIQLISGAQGENQNAKIGTISRAFKLIAMRYDIPVLFLSQLNRDVEKTKREPNLADLRDSGSLEQDASLVMFLHQEGEDNDFDEGDFKIIVAKNRKGRVGQISNIRFLKKYSKFEGTKIETQGELI